MDNVTAAELAHSNFLIQIQDNGALTGLLQFAYADDQASYIHQDQSRFSRLQVMEEVLTSDQIDYYICQIQAGDIQPIVNLSLGSAYLSWWDPTHSFNKPLDRFAQKFMLQASRLIQEITYRIETKFERKKSIDEFFEDFTTLRRVGQAIQALRKRLRAGKFKSFNTDDQSQFVHDCFHNAFKEYGSDNSFFYDKQTVDEFLDEYFAF